MFTQFVRNLTGFDYQVADYISYELQRKWPQLNPKTQVSYVQYWEVKISRPVTTKIGFDDMFFADTWKRWWRSMFWHYTPETLEERMSYSRLIVRQLLHIPTLIRKTLSGQMRVEIQRERESMIVSAPLTDTVRLDRFVCSTNLDRYEIICGYYAPTDTLFVYKR